MSDVGFATLPGPGGGLRIEYRRVGTPGTSGPHLVFLHEGLGSVSAWRDFPDRLCAATATRGLVYSRPGYGRSTPRAAHEHWGPDFLHRQALDVLPALLDALAIDTAREPVVLYGHSDGGSIALIHAAHHPGRVRALVVEAPHILVEDLSVDSIGRVRQAWQQPGLRERLARHHDDPDSAFGGWSGAWLDPRFRSWSIEDEIASIACPVLAIQGLQDEYGTLEQVRGIARRVRGTQLLELPGCGHAPHREQAAAVIEAVRHFLAASAGIPGDRSPGDGRPTPAAGAGPTVP